MLFQPTNIVPDTRTGIGFGTVDATNGIQFSWQVNGNYPVMTAFNITIYRNDTLSTQLYTTGRLTTNCPFKGRDALGEIAFFTYSVSAATLSGSGITNGGEYKYTIRQYYDDGGVETSILQSSASVFITRAASSFAFAAINVTEAEYTFTVNYSQAQGDTVDWIRYQIQTTSGAKSEELYDSGKIFGTPVYEITYNGFMDGENYSIRATGQTSSGVNMDTGWVSFTPSYNTSPLTANVVAACQRDYSAVKVSWAGATTLAGQDIWIVYRKRAGSLVMDKLGEINSSVTSVYDFGAASGQGPYTYYLFAGTAGYTDGNNDYHPTVYLSSAVTSNAVSPVYYRWSLLDCVLSSDGTYSVQAEYDFKYNMDSGSMANNNTPGVLQNFTAKPTVQPAPQNFKSGTLTALIGSVGSNGKYTDSLAIRNAIMALSATDDTLFLKSSKGDVLQVRLNGPVTAATTENAESLAQSVMLPWVEIDDETESIIALPGNGILA